MKWLLLWKKCKKVGKYRYVGQIRNYRSFACTGCRSLAEVQSARLQVFITTPIVLYVIDLCRRSKKWRKTIVGQTIL